MLSSLGFQAKILCIFVYFLIPRESYGKGASKWWFGTKTCARPSFGIIFNEEAEKEWNETFSYPDQTIPEHFDARDRWPHCESIKHVAKEAEGCNNSWAITVATMLTDRLCIYKGKNQAELSINDIVTCCTKCVETPGQCENVTRNARFALEYWAKNGIVSGATFSKTNLGCKPYSNSVLNSSTGSIASCQAECDSGNYIYDEDTIFGKGLGCIFKPWDYEQVQIEIMTNGPIATSLDATNHFRENYIGGVYEGTEEETKGNATHATPTVVKIIGWGVEGEHAYWLAASCWGEQWGEKGFFKIKRGQNVRNFEDQAYTGYFHENLVETDASTSSATIFNGSFFIIFLFSFFIRYLQGILV